MIIKVPAIVSRDGKLRLANRKPTPGKDEISINLELEIPDSAFAPPTLTMRATVAPSINGHTVIERPAPSRKPLAIQTPWTGERVRKVRALLQIEREELAGRLGVRVATVKEWEEGRLEVGESSIERLERMEADAIGITS